MWVLAVDVGTTFTVAAVREVDGSGGGRPPEIVPLADDVKLASAVYCDPDGRLLVGPQIPIGAPMTGRLERTPKALFGTGKVPLGGQLVDDVELVAALLRFAATAAREMCNGQPPMWVRLTHPATWQAGKQRRLLTAAERAGLPAAQPVSEPVAAAAALAFRGALTDLADGARVAVCDVGGGTCDLSLLRHQAGRFTLVGQPVGGDRLGGEMLDQQLVDLVLSYCTEQEREYLTYPDTADDPDGWAHAYDQIRTGVRTAKERLKYIPTSTISLPPPVVSRPNYTLTRDQLNNHVIPLINQIIELLNAELLYRNGTAPTDLAAICLAGGGTKLALIPRMLEAAFGCPIVAHGDLATLVAYGATIVGADPSQPSLPETQRSAMTAEQIPPEPAQQRRRRRPTSTPSTAEHIIVDSGQPDLSGMRADARQQLADEDTAERYARGLLDGGQHEPAVTPLTEAGQERPGYRDATALLTSPQGSLPTRVVAKSGGHHTTIGAAIAAAAAGDRILIKPGRYDESLILDKDLEILGDGPIEEIIVAAGSAVVSIWTGTGHIGNLTIRQTGTQEGLLESTITAALQIEGGQPTVQDCDISSSIGVGVLVRGNADPTIRSNRIHDNKKSGVFVYKQGRGTFEDNDIFGNVLAGVEVSSRGDPTVRSNRIHDGKQGGVFVYKQGRGTFEDNDIFGNVLAGVGAKSGGDPIVRGNRIHENQNCGVFVTWWGCASILDNDIFSNTPSNLKISSTATVVASENRIH